MTKINIIWHIIRIKNFNLIELIACNAAINSSTYFHVLEIWNELLWIQLAGCVTNKFFIRFPLLSYFNLKYNIYSYLHAVNHLIGK